MMDPQRDVWKSRSPLACGLLYVSVIDQFEDILEDCQLSHSVLSAKLGQLADLREEQWLLGNLADPFEICEGIPITY